MRPVHYDPSFQPLFTTPGHPSYPSAHSCLSGAAAGVISYLFPSETDRYQPLLETIGEARIWASIHFRRDEPGPTRGGESDRAHQERRFGVSLPREGPPDGRRP